MNVIDVDIQLKEASLNPEECMQFVDSASAGSMNIFVGKVRNHTGGKPVTRLDFEAYAPMAISEMKKIAHQAFDRWPVQKLSIHHRIGTLTIGEIAVVIAVTTPHRKAGFEACAFVIDTLKETVPIWKKEIFEDGEVWVSAHP